MIAQPSSVLTINGKPATPAELKRIGIVAQPVIEEDDFDREHRQWLRENGLDKPMTAQEIEGIARYELAYLDK